jgi:Uma2 family endonuclease
MKTASPRAIRWRREEYYRMAEVGLFSGRRVELIRGEIIEMSPQHSPHATGIRLTDRALRRIFVSGWVVSVQMPLALGLDSDPEPDVSVVFGSVRDFTASHPTSAVLVVEVAETSLDYDREKGGLYAEAGVEDYWIVNVLDRELEVYRGPRKDPSHVYGSTFATKTILRSGDTVSPLAAPRASIRVADLLP